MNGVKLLAFLICWFMCVSAQGAEPFKCRGYYVTFMRMPVMGLAEWKEAIDCFAEDDYQCPHSLDRGRVSFQKIPHHMAIQSGPRECQERLRPRINRLCSHEKHSRLARFHTVRL